MPNAVNIPQQLAILGENLEQHQRRFAQEAHWVAEELGLVKKKKTTEEIFHILLDGIKEIYGVDAVIAGGAVRDLAAGAEFKDVDLFIPMPWKDFMGGFPELGWQNAPVLVGKGPYGAKKVTTPNPLPFETTARAQARVQGALVDLVFTKEPLTRENVSTFPIHAQRGIWALDGGSQLSPEMVKDLSDKTFTISDQITDKVKLRKAHNKASEWLKRPGYAGWKIVTPDIKEWWEAEEDKKKAAEEYNPFSNTAWTSWGTTSTFDMIPWKAIA